MNMSDQFTWPYEVRQSEPDEFGVFVQKGGQNFGPTTDQRIKAGVVKQVVRLPIRVLDLGDNLIIDSVDPDGTLHLHATGSGGGVVGSGQFVIDDGEFGDPDPGFVFDDGEL